MITSLKWVPIGSNQRIPKRYVMEEEDVENYKKYSDRQIELAKKGLQQEQQKLENFSLEQGLEGLTMEEQEIEEEEESEEEIIQKGKDENDLSIYNLDNYDEEPTEVSIFRPVEDMIEQETEDDIQLSNLQKEELEEEEELIIEPEDSLLLSGKTEQDLSSLEVYLFEKEANNVYVHHDILLPSFPLNLEWFNYTPGKKDIKGSFVAIASFEPEIEIWDLDVIDAVYPVAVLGKKNEKKKKKINENYHIDAVMCLNWNKSHSNLLASSSADTTIKIWDLDTCKAVRSFHLHKDKVQCVQWHPIESTILLSGGYDHQIKIFDSRSPQSSQTIQLNNDIENIKWNPFELNQFYVSLDNGIVMNYDVRNITQSLFTLHCHDKAVSAMDINPIIPHCLVTGSTDKTVKVWDLKNHQPSMVVSRDFDLGQVFSLSFNPDHPYNLAMAGSNGKAKIWDISNNQAIYRKFSNSGYQFDKPYSGLEKLPISVEDDNGSDLEDME